MTSILIDPMATQSIILASMIIYPESRKKAIQLLTNEDFEGNVEREIFCYIKQIEIERGTVDLSLLGETIKDKDKKFFDKIGGYHYLSTLVNGVGIELEIEGHCRKLKDDTVARILKGIIKSSQEELALGTGPDIVLERISSKIKNLKANKPNADSTYRHLLEATSEEEISSEIRNTSPGVRVGFKVGEIDLKLPGGAITIVAGPTGHGKTMVLINFILNYLELHPEKQAFFFSYEESRSSILSLFLNTYINKNISKNNRESIKSYFRDGNVQFTAQESRAIFLTKKETFFKDLIETKRLNIFYSDYSVEELVQAVRFLKKNVNIGLVSIDYMQLLGLLNKKTIPRQEELKHICLMLKNCAVDTGLPILLAAQFNRTVSAEADLSPTAIGEAGDIERAANMVIGLWNRNYAGFDRDGNKGKNNQTIPKSPTMYLEILKGRETGIGHSSVFDLNGNTGKLSPLKGNDGGLPTKNEHTLDFNR